MALARACTDELQMKAFRDNFGGQSAEKLPGILVLLRKKKGGMGRDSEAAAEVENVEHNGIIQLFWER